MIAADGLPTAQAGIMIYGVVIVIILVLTVVALASDRRGR